MYYFDTLIGLFTSNELYYVWKKIIWFRNFSLNMQCNYFTIKEYLPCWLNNNDLVKNFIQHVLNGLIIHLTNSLNNNIC